MTRNDIVRKLASRKFLLSLAAFIAVFCTGAAGAVPPGWCAVGMALSAGIYAACEAYVDGQNAKANQTVSSTSVTATSASAKVVERAFAGNEADNG